MTNFEKKVLVVVGHPDDEILLCGGAIAWHVAQGHPVKVVIVAQGIFSRGMEGAEAKKIQLSKEMHDANEVLGVHDVVLLDFPDQKLDTIPILEITQRIETIIDEYQPTVVYTHHSGDLNVDHEIVHRAVLTATRPVPEQVVKEVYAGEVLSSTEWSTPSTTSVFTPNVYLDVTEYFDKKIEALEVYASEIRDYPHPRSVKGVEAQATLRGVETGVEKAEAFMLLRALH